MDLDSLTGDFDIKEFEAVSIASDGEVMPAKTDKVALIDADTIAFIACLNAEVGDEVLEDFCDKEEWFNLLANNDFDQVDNILYTTCPILAMKNAERKLQKILDKTGCTKYELHFSGGKENFRYYLQPDGALDYSIRNKYKANRTVRVPAGLSELKKAMCDKHNGELHTKWEADDIVVYKKINDYDKYVLCAIDKDVLNSIQGTHFNYYESIKAKKAMGYKTIDKYTAMTWRYIQTLTGDTSDNIIGLKNVGPVTASKIIAGCFTHRELWIAVCKAYESKGRTLAEALNNLNMVDMRLLTSIDGSLQIVLRTQEDLLND